MDEGGGEMNKCRFCGNEDFKTVIDFGHQPLSNSFLKTLDEPEIYYPLKVVVCDKCKLVQTTGGAIKGIFEDDYIYYSSQSPANVSHAKEYVEMMIGRFHPRTVLEIGSNDGYMLQWFKEKGCEVLGIDPADGPAHEARKKGINTVCAFFGADFQTRPHWSKKTFDLICGINVLAHQQDINDFVKGLKIALAPEGIITFEFPHLMKMIEGDQFDPIYHEHYHYFSFGTIDTIFWEHGLEIFDVDEIPEHGGSLRIYARHLWLSTSRVVPRTGKVIAMILKERHMDFSQFAVRAARIKSEFMEFLYDCLGRGETMVAYGASAKSNTFLNYCGVKPDVMPFIVDRSPHKQGKFLPGSNIPVVDESSIKEFKPDYILIPTWNLKEEIMDQLSYIREWSGKFVVAIPNLQIL
jgi:SAM-dependent methyltransferase